MPWEIIGNCVHKKDSDTPIPGGCHDTRAEAEAHLRALYANESGSLTVRKAADGAYRWVLISSNAFEDRDGEIVSQKALEADVVRADADGQYGPLLWWHEPGLVLGTCDGNAMHGRMLVEWGRFKSAAIGEAMAKAAPALRVSIGFHHPVSEPDPEGVFENVRRFERSLLPAHVASNPLTAMPIVSKESIMLKEKMDALKAVFGGDDAFVKHVLASAESSEKAAAAAGTRHKEAKPKDDDEPVTEDEAADKPFPKAEAEDDEEPKKEKAAVVGDMTRDEFTAFLGATLKSVLEPVEARVAAVETATRQKEADAAAQAAAYKSFDDKLNALTQTAEKALRGVAELKGELPRVLGDKSGGTYRASERGPAPADELVARIKANEAGQGGPHTDPMAKHFTGLFPNQQP